MDYSLLLQNFAKHISLTKAEEAFVTPLFEHQKIAAKKFLLKQGDVCKHSAFVLDGCLRGYTIDSNGDEHVLSFAPKEWWIGDMYSLISQKPGNLNIEAMNDTEILLLSKTDQEKLYRKVPKFERFFRIITENSLVSYQQRLNDNMSLTAQERYLKFCKIYPQLIHTIPQKQIAAYIGVTPEFLSKLRAKYVKHKSIS
ncbi:MAG: Crp/Fnr family transcriptional regulator [Bacteroidetes bacterium]|jgi:CRP-like cAMP-binding protein|nr:Crp/Fnr family transcriptional regulator [Bacteroidota bacterium]MDF2452786.1 Crp/Fnr family transcriptional regulator [Bacteroidota bacterium]